MAASSSATLFLQSSQFPGDRLRRQPPAAAGRTVSVRVGFMPSAVHTSTETQQHCDSAKPVAASFYDVLGIPARASGKEIKAAYRRLALEYHPDVRKDTAAEEDFMRLHAAYSTLSDPEKRSDYDRRFRVRPTSRGPSFSRFSRRTWETDQCW